MTASPWLNEQLIILADQSRGNEKDSSNVDFSAWLHPVGVAATDWSNHLGDEFVDLFGGPTDERFGIQNLVEIDAGKSRISRQAVDKVVFLFALFQVRRHGETVLANPFVQFLAVAAFRHNFHQDIFS